MYWLECSYGLYLHDDAILYQEVDSEGGSDLATLIEDRNR